MKPKIPDKKKGFFTGITKEKSFWILILISILIAATTIVARMAYLSAG